MKEYNEYLSQNYEKFSELFDNQIKTHEVMKIVYRKKLFQLTGENKIQINLAYDYLSNSNRRQCYNPQDKKKFQKVEYNPILFVLKNDVIAIKMLLENSSRMDFDVNTKGINDMSLLYMACRCGYIDIVKLLLRSGSNPSVVQGNNSSALHAAAFYGHKDIVKLLLQVGVNAELKNNFGNLAEDEALNEEIKKLIEDFKAKDKSYKFFQTNNCHFKDVKFVFFKNDFVGKRAKLKDKNPRRNFGWDLSWHGTKLDSIPSIISNGLKKCGEVVEGKIIDIRRDVTHIEKGRQVREIPNWALAVFTSQSIFYSSDSAYAEHFKDLDGRDWILILECRIENGTYKKYEHTFSSYEFRNNEDKLLENRSPNSNSVDIFAVWQFNKEFLNKQKDFNVLMDILYKYIYEV